jgi:hypothetical protein
MQLSFLPTPEITFNCYHDESGTYTPQISNSGEKWLFHGVLLVPTTREIDLVAQLRKIREQNSYFEEIHYKKIRKTSGQITNCVKGWLKIYLNFSENCYYHCLAVNTHSSQFDNTRFSEPYYCYNYFARTAIVGAISWSLAHYHTHSVYLNIFSDSKRRQANDNFVTYVASEVQKTMLQKKREKSSRYPTLYVNNEVILVNSDPQKVQDSLKDQCELIQLTDLLTSNIAQAIKASSDQAGKIALALEISNWIDDTRKPPWLQSYELHRRFSVSCFPDERGDFYNADLPIKTKKQPMLFDIETQG